MSRRRGMGTVIAIAALGLAVAGALHTLDTLGKHNAPVSSAAAPAGPRSLICLCSRHARIGPATNEDAERGRRAASDPPGPTTAPPPEPGIRAARATTCGTRR